MVSPERSRKKVKLPKKFMVHFSLCFVMGFFTGFAPTGKSIFHSHVAYSNRLEFAPQPTKVSQKKTTDVNRSWIAPKPSSIVHKHEKPWPQLKPKRLVIIVTPTSTKLPFQTVVFLTRLANTIKLVPEPLLWIVVEGQTQSSELSKMLRKTGVMYRHLVSKENFTDLEAELNHQRKAHCASQAKWVFGTWPTTLLATNMNKVTIEGPVCDSSQVMGWHLRNMNNETDTINPPIHISSFAFNSSILWDPERWGRTSSLQDTSQNSIKFVKQVVAEDEAKLKGIPSEDCSKILFWRFNFHA